MAKTPDVTVDITGCVLDLESAAQLRNIVIHEYKKTAPKDLKDGDSICMDASWSFMVRGLDTQGKARQFSCHWYNDSKVVRLHDGDPSCVMMLAYLMLAEYCYGNIHFTVDRPAHSLDLAEAALRLAQGAAPKITMPEWVKRRSIADAAISVPATMDFRA